jgi:hypothetical protein
MRKEKRFFILFQTSKRRKNARSKKKLKQVFGKFSRFSGERQSYNHVALDLLLSLKRLFLRQKTKESPVCFEIRLSLQPVYSPKTTGKSVANKFAVDFYAELRFERECQSKRYKNQIFIDFNPVINV